MAIDPLSLIIGGISLVSGLAAQGEQKAAYEAQQAEKVSKYEYDIERIKEETAGTVGDIKREGAAYTRSQEAAIGASGAEIGGGTPLMSMIETATSIERDIIRVKRAAQLETEYLQEEIDKLKPKKKKPVKPKENIGSWTSRMASRRTSNVGRGYTGYPGAS